MGKTTDLNKLRCGHPFTWGTVIKIHDVSRFTLVEFMDNRSEQIVGARDSILFHVYVRDKDTHESCVSFDAALICAIARDRMEPNRARWMAIAAAKILDVELSRAE